MTTPTDPNAGHEPSQKPSGGLFSGTHRAIVQVLNELADMRQQLAQRPSLSGDDAAALKPLVELLEPQLAACRADDLLFPIGQSFSTFGKMRAALAALQDMLREQGEKRYTYQEYLDRYGRGKPEPDNRTPEEVGRDMAKEIIARLEHPAPSQPPTPTRYTVTYRITGGTPEVVSEAHAVAKRDTAPDAVSVFVSRTFPGGIEKREEERFRIGDYFTSVGVSDISGDRLSFTISWHVRNGVDSWWKDLIVRLLSTLRGIGCDTTTLPQPPTPAGEGEGNFSGIAADVNGRVDPTQPPCPPEAIETMDAIIKWGEQQPAPAQPVAQDEVVAVSQPTACGVSVEECGPHIVNKIEQMRRFGTKDEATEAVRFLAAVESARRGDCPHKQEIERLRHELTVEGTALSGVATFLECASTESLFEEIPEAAGKHLREHLDKAADELRRAISPDSRRVLIKQEYEIEHWRIKAEKAEQEIERLQAVNQAAGEQAAKSIEALQAVIERLTKERDGLHSQCEHWERIAQRLASDALIVVSRTLPTPEKGYLAEPQELRADIGRIIARAQRAESLAARLAAVMAMNKYRFNIGGCCIDCGARDRCVTGCQLAAALADYEAFAAGRKESEPSNVDSP